MNDDVRIALSLTFDEIAAVIVVLRSTDLGSIHACRLKQTGSALDELIDVKRRAEQMQRRT